jgi:hypothetical protein
MIPKREEKLRKTLSSFVIRNKIIARKLNFFVSNNVRLCDSRIQGIRKIKKSFPHLTTYTCELYTLYNGNVF